MGTVGMGWKVGADQRDLLKNKCITEEAAECFMQTSFMFKKLDIGLYSDAFGILSLPPLSCCIYKFKVKTATILTLFEVWVEKGSKLLPGTELMMISKPGIPNVHNITQLPYARLDIGDDLEIYLEAQIDDTMACTIETIKCI